MSLNETELNKALDYAAKGLTMREIAKVIGCSTNDVVEHAERMRDARARARALLKAKQHDLAMEGNPGALAALTNPKKDKKIDKLKKAAQQQIMQLRDEAGDDVLAIGPDGAPSLDLQLKRLGSTAMGARMINRALKVSLIMASFGDGRTLKELFSRFDGAAVKTERKIDLNKAAKSFASGGREGDALQAISKLTPDQTTNLLMQLIDVPVMDAEVMETPVE